jgi:hypothetical protein
MGRAANFITAYPTAVNHVGARWAALRTGQRDILGRIPAYTVADFLVGPRRDSWSAELYLNYAFDQRGNLNRFSQCSPGTCGAITYQIVNQPRRSGIEFGQKFSAFSRQLSASHPWCLAHTSAELVWRRVAASFDCVASSLDA